MGYLSCRAESSIATCRSISSLNPVQSHRSRPNKNEKSNSKDNAESDGGGGGGTDGPSADSLHRRRHLRRFSYRELESATGYFSDAALLGRGSHGAVYKALLPGGRAVAVKRPSRRPNFSPSPCLSAAARDEVENEIDILSSLRGPRLVNLIGFSAPSAGGSRREHLLVVEFMPNGTLYDLLHSEPRPPGWARRLRLALQTAKALLALHSAAPPVIHRDIKSANVLIDAGGNARLGDFGLALRDDSAADGNGGEVPSSARSTPPAGTLGYLDPGYVTPENLSTKTDVFSFGILLFEIMSGRKAIDVNHSPASVVEWAVPLLKKGKVSAIFDPRIAPPKDQSTRRQLALLAATCVRSCKERRPSMAEVVEQLRVLSKAVPSRAWNGLSVVNPCLVVETETTLSKLNPDNLNRDRSVGSVSWLNGMEEEEEKTAGVKKPPPVGLRGSRPLRSTTRVFSDAGGMESKNLMDLMAQLEGEPIRGLVVGAGGSHRSTTISRARTLHVTRDYYDQEAVLRLRRNQTVRGIPLETFSRLNGIDKFNGKIHGLARDLL